MSIGLLAGRGRIRSRSLSTDRAVGIWLLIVAMLVVAMILLGGATRLTHSGLSIVEWRPLMGALPPLDDTAWQRAFEDYQRFPEYQKINAGMTLSEFKRIFAFEYAHRLLGRAIGLSFLLPFLWFLWRGQIDPRLRLPLVVLFCLGGLQGLIGWWMVKSGLVDQPDVSHFRLTIHLGLAVSLFAALLWVGLGRLGMQIVARGTGLPAATFAVGLLAFLQILSGGLVAGLDAGLVYPTFPTLGGHWLPPELAQSSGSLAEFLHEPVTVQFLHRCGAFIVLGAVVVLWLAARRRSALLTRALDLVLLAAVLQFCLGILTLVNMVPVPLGLAHQGGALLLLASLILALRRQAPRVAV